MVLHWSPSDSKSPQVSRTLLGILADLNNAIVWMVSICPLIPTSSSPCITPLMTVPSAPITIGITVAFMFQSFFQFLSKVQVFIPLFAFLQRSPLFGRFSFFFLSFFLSIFIFIFIFLFFVVDYH